MVTELMLGALILATLAANAYSGTGHGIARMALAMWPGIAFSRLHRGDLRHNLVLTISGIAGLLSGVHN